MVLIFTCKKIPSYWDLEGNSLIRVQKYKKFHYSALSFWSSWSTFQDRYFTVVASATPLKWRWSWKSLLEEAEAFVSSLWSTVCRSCLSTNWHRHYYQVHYCRSLSYVTRVCHRVVVVPIPELRTPARSKTQILLVSLQTKLLCLCIQFSDSPQTGASCIFWVAEASMSNQLPFYGTCLVAIRKEWKVSSEPVIAWGCLR